MTPGEAALRNAPAAFTPASAAFRLATSASGAAGSRNRDRAGAGRRLAARAAGIAEHPLRQVRELRQVLIDEGVAGAGETGQPVLDIGRVARLRHLAVVDEVDAGLDLFLHHLGDGGADPRRRAPRGRPARLPPWRTSSGSGRPAAAGCRYGSSETAPPDAIFRSAFRKLILENTSSRRKPGPPFSGTGR